MNEHSVEEKKNAVLNPAKKNRKKRKHKTMKMEVNGNAESAPKENKLSLRERKFRKRKAKKIKKVTSNLIIEKTDLPLTLQKQVEYYFSDSNLSHDRFLRSLLMQNQEKREIDVSLLLTFPRVHNLIAEIPDPVAKADLLKQALSKSHVVTLSEDNTKIRRKQPIGRFGKGRQEEDLRTVYVENIPALIALESLANCFSKAGGILRVSFPKNVPAEEPKGYAFIEFQVAYPVMN